MREQKWLVNPGQSKTIDLDDVTRVKIGLIGGQIDIIGHDEPTTRVEVRSVTGKDLKVSLIAGRLEIDHPQLRWDNFIDVFRAWNGKARAEVSVLVPRDAQLKLGTVGADALVSGIHTDAKLSTVSGDITADGLVGDVELNAVNGEIVARNHRGSISANTVSGDITAQGTIPRLTCDGVSGNVFLDIDGTPDAIRANSVSGDLTLRLDPGVGARYRVNSVSGAIRVDGSTFRGAGARKFEYQSGDLDEHWVEVSVNSVSGNTSVVRRAASAASATRDETRAPQPTA